MPSTPKHLFMYEAFGWQAPAYAHVGLLLDDQRQKLSKRNHDTGIDSFQKQGVFPEALTNFVALLGWSHRLDSDKMDLKSLIDNVGISSNRSVPTRTDFSEFDLKFTKGNTVVKFQKLGFLQRLYAEQYAAEDGPKLDSMVEEAVMVLETQGQLQIPPHHDLRSYVHAILRANAKFYYPLDGFFERHRSFFTFDLKQDGISQDHLDHRELISLAYRKLQDVPEAGWTRERIQEQLDQVVDQGCEMESPGDENPKIKKQVASNLLHGLRQIVMDSRPGPPMSDCLQILGKDTAMARLSRIEQVPDSAATPVQQTP